MRGGATSESHLAFVKGAIMVKTKKEKKEDKPKIEPVFVPKIVEYFEFAGAQRGECHAMILIDGEPKKITLQEKIYRIPKNLTHKKKRLYEKALIKAGFVKVSYVENKDERIPEPKTEKFYRYTMMHPDHGEKNPKVGSFAITVEGEDIQYELENGVVQIETVAEHEELVKQGFIESGKVEIDPPEDKPSEELPEGIEENDLSEQEAPIDSGEEE